MQMMARRRSRIMQLSLRATELTARSEIPLPGIPASLDRPTTLLCLREAISLLGAPDSNLALSATDIASALLWLDCQTVYSISAGTWGHPALPPFSDNTESPQYRSALFMFDGSAATPSSTGLAVPLLPAPEESLKYAQRILRTALEMVRFRPDTTGRENNESLSGSSFTARDEDRDHHAAAPTARAGQFADDPASSLEPMTDVERKGAQEAQKTEEAGLLLLSEKSGLLTPVEIATVYGVDRKTSTRLGKAGRLAWGRTSDGQRRDRPDDARVLLGGIPQLGDD
ncbi:hypothetical protein Ssi03_36230 [Sphaerisporangium siamense]|nr:hypothetical protein Ssi03_36230 [Sphaerisporangium siamense]